MIRKLLTLLYSSWSRLRSVCLPVKIFHGTPHGGDAPFCFSYIGWDKKIMHYFLNSIFKEYDRKKGTRFIFAGRLERYVNTLSRICDFALLELISNTARKNSRDIYGFLVPRWLKMHLDVVKSFEILSDKRNSIRRRVRKFNLGVEIGTREEDFEFFFENMYKPYIRDRHKGSAVVSTYKKMFNHPGMESARIFFVTHEGKRIGGMYEQFFAGVPYLHSVGVLEGSSEYLRMGAIGACYLFAIEEYKKNNIPRVNIGGTSPLLTDGLTKFKTSLGARISEPDMQDSIRLKLLLLKYSHGLSEYLMNSGFVHIDRDQIHCALFKNRQVDETDPDFEKLILRTRSMGTNHIDMINITP